MAAGLGFKDFTTGEVLTAADVDGYLMQGIWVFANATARDAAVTSPQEGNFAFTKDNNSLWYYDGAAWVSSGATGDIEGVTAGVGISGGGTSGTVTITNAMATEITASGDIIVGTGSGTFDNLPIGTTGQILTADTSVSPYKVKWATASSGSPANGQAYVGTKQNTTSSSYTDLTTSGPAVTLTTGTKALVIVSFEGTNRAANRSAWMSFAVSGATTVAATDTNALKITQSTLDWEPFRASSATLVTGLTAGSNTFTAKYRSDTITTCTADFAYREILVVDMGS
jgi:hypothetical protein